MSEEKSIVVAPPPNLGVVVLPKRKKGRPRKNLALVPVPLGENSTAPQNPDKRGRKPKRKNGDVGWPAMDNAFVGQQVHGVLDGSFDAGYLLTVRVGNTQTVLRGAVFEPSLSVPISKSNDIAPNVRFIRRNEQVAPLQYPVENSSTSMPPSHVVVPPVHISNVAPTQSAPTPMEQDQTPPCKTAMTGPAHVSSAVMEAENDLFQPMVTSDDHKEMASPLHSSDFGAEQKMEVQTIANCLN